MIPKPRVEQGIKRDVKFEDDILGTITLSVLNIGFGVVDGLINSVPTSDQLQYCGRFTAAQRQGITWAYNNYTENMDLTKTVDAMIYTVRLSKFLVLSCWFGANPYTKLQLYVDLIMNLDLLWNFLYNIGFLYVDITMLISGIFAPLESDIFYFMSFYSVDLIGRMLYRDGSTANCWFTWSGCNGIVN